MKKYQHLFDCSNLDPSHPFFTLEIQRVVGMFKDEKRGREIQEFVGLHSKMYSFTISDPCADVSNIDGYVKKVKGIQQSIFKTS